MTTPHSVCTRTTSMNSPPFATATPTPYTTVTTTRLPVDAHYDRADNEDRSTKTFRHSLWASTAVFSIIALVSLLQSFGKVKDQGRAVKWSVAGVSCALGLSSLAVLAGMFIRRMFIGTMLEGSLAFMTLVLWAIATPYIMDPQHNLATTGPYTEVYHANLYFSTWAALLTSMYIFTSFCRHQLEKRRGLPEGGSSMFLFSGWATLAATSLILMSAASYQLDRLDCSSVDSAQCNRTSFAISLGAFSGLIAFIWMLLVLMVRISTMANTLMACILLVAWCFGVSYITWGGHERAAPVLGNVYFFTWGSFGVALALAATGLNDLIGAMMGDDMTGVHIRGETTTNTNTLGEKPADPAAYSRGSEDPEVVTGVDHA